MATEVDRARRPGYLPVTLTAGFAADVVFGVVRYRTRIVPQPFDRRLVNHLGLLTAAPPAGPTH